MRRSQEYYLSVLGRLKEQADQLNKMIQEGSFYRLPFTQRYARIRRVKRLYNRLRGPIGDKKLVSVLAPSYRIYRVYVFSRNENRVENQSVVFG